MRTAAEAKLRENVAVFHDGHGTERSDRADRHRSRLLPQRHGLLGKVGHYLAKVWELLSTPPREANTEGGCCRQSSAR